MRRKARKNEDSKEASRRAACDELLLFLLWEYLPRVKDRPSCRDTGHGAKTKDGLVAAIRAILYSPI